MQTLSLLPTQRGLHCTASAWLILRVVRWFASMKGSLCLMNALSLTPHGMICCKALGAQNPLQTCLISHPLFEKNIKENL